jgi:hypothetical protein
MALNNRAMATTAALYLEGGCAGPNRKHKGHVLCP